jgi:hypothetical protein
MIRTLIVSVAFMGLAGPAVAQEAPQPPAPFQVARLQPDMSGAVSLPTRRRDGDIGKATVVFMLSPELSEQMSGIGRMDLDYEFQCEARQSRTVAMTAWAPDGSLMARLPDQVSEWEAVNPTSPNELTRAFICDGGALEGPQVDSIAAFARLHRDQ